jgi:hypothetical protein
LEGNGGILILRYYLGIILEGLSKTTKILWFLKSMAFLKSSCTTEVRSPAEAKNFSSNLCVQTGCGAHPASFPVGTGGRDPFPGGKAQLGRDVDN